MRKRVLINMHITRKKLKHQNMFKTAQNFFPEENAKKSIKITHFGAEKEQSDEITFPQEYK